MTASRTEFAILGAGAIGSIVGAHLARAGHSVTMLVRERRAAQLRRDGLKIKGLAELATPVDVLTDASQLRGADVLIVAMKTPGTAEALEPLRKADVGVAFSIQNGMWKDDALARVFGAERVLGCLANTSGELLPSGEVLFTRNVNIYVGELPAGSSDRAERIARAIDASGVRSTAVPDVLSREWTKFVGWVGLMLMSITTRTVTWRYLSDPDCALVLVRLVREVAAIAKAAGVPLTTEDTLLPLQGILSGSDEAAVQAVLQAGRDFQTNSPEPPPVVAPGPGGGPAAGNPGNARLCGPAGTGVAAARAVARRALPPRGGDRSDARRSVDRSALAVARSGAVMTAPSTDPRSKGALWKPAEPRRSRLIRSSCRCGSGTLRSIPSRSRAELGIDAEHSFRAGEPRESGRSTVAPVHAESYWLGTLDPGHAVARDGIRSRLDARGQPAHARDRIRRARLGAHGV